MDNLLKTPFQTIGLIHTHPNGSSPSGFRGDGSFMVNNFSFKPMYVLLMGEKASIYLLYINDKAPFNWKTSGYSESLSSMSVMTIRNLLEGRISLINFTKTNIDIFKKKLP